MYFIKNEYLKENEKKTAYLYAANSLIDKEKALQNARLSYLAPLFYERCNYNAMIEFITIWRLKG